MEKPKCPYCGEEMKFSYGYDGYTNGHYWYRCDNCNALAPEADSPEEAYVAAMKRDRAKGKWKWNDDNGYYYCSECGAVSPREDQDGEYIDCPHYCHNCGADMRKETNDER